MGALFSTPEGLPPQLEFCADQLKAANKCMADLNFDREVYRTKCAHLFAEYKDCRKSWKQLKTDLVKAHRTGELPPGVALPKPNDEASPDATKQ